MPGPASKERVTQVEALILHLATKADRLSAEIRWAAGIFVALAIAINLPPLLM